MEGLEMTRLERLGAELAMALLREQEYAAALSDTRALIEKLKVELFETPAKVLYAPTQTHPVVPDNRETQQFQAPEFEQCPGYGCAYWEKGLNHAHMGGRVWANEPEPTS